MHRFVVPRVTEAGATVRLGDADAHHAAVVLRLREGDRVRLMDGRGLVADARLARVDRPGVEAVIESVLRQSAPRVEVGLAVGITKGKAWDWTLQKCTEAGVTRIVPILARRSVVRLDASEAARRREEWMRTVEEACKQCGAAWWPEVSWPVSMEAWLAGLGHAPESAEARWVAALVEPRRPLLDAARRVEPGIRSAWVAVGPEGDWDPEELEGMRGAGFEGVTLGPNVMRSETAAVAAVVLMRAALDAA